jgi:NAD(P)-dependent dehydrogenase (short-subunit alcohol dehydrogenase family)
MSKLTGKVAIVTGASKGIGAGIAKSLAAEGVSVAVNYSSSQEGADRVVAEITGTGGTAIAVQADVSKGEDVERLFEETEKAFGPLDVLVNNAGVFQFDSLEAVTETEFHREFNTNVLGPILMTQGAVKRFGPRGERDQHRFGGGPESTPGGSNLCGDQERPGQRHARPSERAGLEEDASQLDQSGWRGNRGHPYGWNHRQRLRKADGGADPAGTNRPAGRHRAGRGVPGLRGVPMDDGRDPRGSRRLAMRRRDDRQVQAFYRRKVV